MTNYEISISCNSRIVITHDGSKVAMNYYDEGKNIADSSFSMEGFSALQISSAMFEMIKNFTKTLSTAYGVDVNWMDLKKKIKNYE